jgi:hypothetical protein
MRRLTVVLALVLVGGLVLVYPLLRRGGADASSVRWREAPPAGTPVPPLECEAEGYPCSWDQASPAALERTMVLATRAANEFAAGGVTAAAAWLGEQTDVVRVEVGPGVAGFRIDGGRYTWVGEMPSTVKTSGRVAWWDRLADAIVPTAHAQVVGQDQFTDGKINQRDFRRAVLVDKVIAIGERDDDPSKALAAIPAYTGHVEVRKSFTNTEKSAGAVESGEPDVLAWRDFLGWEAFDLIFVSTETLRTCTQLATVGSSADASPDSSAGSGLLRQLLGALGITGEEETPAEEPDECEPRGFFTGDFIQVAGTADNIRTEVLRRTQANGYALDFVVLSSTPTKDCSASPLGGCETFDVLLAAVMVTPDFFGQVYGKRVSSDPGGISMDRKLIYLNAPYSNQFEGLYQRFFGSRRESTLLTRDGDDGWAVGAFAGMSVLIQTLADGFAVDASPVSSVDPAVWSHGSQVRGREIVTLLAEDGSPLQDGMPLPFEGILNDGIDDALTVTALVEGLFDGFPGAPPAPAMAWLEVDGQRVGQEQRVLADPAVYNWGTVAFERVPLGLDLTTAAYEVDVVVRIDRGRRELSESRYSVSLLAVDPLCDWSAQVSGLTTASMGGAAMATAYTRTGSRVSSTLNFHHAPAVDAWALVPDPDTPLTLSLAFPGGLESGLFQVENAVLNGRTFPLSAYGRGTVKLTVTKPSKPAGPPPRTGEWFDAGTASVNGEFSVDFERIQSYLAFDERTGPMNVTGRFHWTAGCPNGLRPGSGGPDWGLPIERERAAGVLPKEFLDSFPRGGGD